ncbi:S41 family peptidase [bacterium]|nr:S41 family peptidase [bacterium]
MDNKKTKIILVVVIVVAAVFGLLGGLLYIQHAKWQVVTPPPAIPESGASASPSPWLPPTDNQPDENGASNETGASSGGILDAMPEGNEVLDAMPDSAEGEDAHDGDSAKASQNVNASQSAKEAPSDKSSQAAQNDKASANAKPLSDKEKKEQEIKELLHKEHLEFYQKLFKAPETLGFVPDSQLFKSIYMRIRSSYVETVTDEKLYDGVVKEIGVLLEAKGIAADGLKNLDPNRSALAQLDEMYGKDFDQRVLYYSAIQGMLSGLDDPYTVLMTPDEYGKLQEEVQSKGFGGIGIYIELDKEAGNQLTVADPVEGCPAEKAGLETGDQILAIDGVATKGMALDVATSKIRGKVGTKVTLKIRREGFKQPFTVSVTRGMIHVVSVSSKMLPNSLGYVRLRQFGSHTGDEVHKELDKLVKNGAKGIVLDLRNNGGGYVDASISVTGEFLPERSLVVYTEGRVEKRHNYLSTKKPLVKVPVAVLINRFSASAAEITAGALRDHKKAVLIGETSFGKGSVQQIFPNDDGSVLKMTVAHFFSPSGYKINHQGLKPDIVKEMEPRLVGKADRDIQLQRAVKYLLEGH